MPNSPSVEPLHTYEGFDNLQAMRMAVRYNAYLTSLVLSGVKPGNKALDFGAGLGDVARAVRDRGAEVTCVEPDRGMRLALARGGLPTFQFLDQVAQGSVDFLYSLNVLEHIEDDVGTLYELRTKLRPGAQVLFFVPAFPAITSSMDRRVGHFRRYTKRDLTRKIESAGMRVISARYADSIGFFASLLYRWVGRSDGAISPASVAFYDRFVFPTSKVLDALTGRWFGKNLLIIAKLDQQQR